ncbi:minor capsid protein E [Vibrio phage PVP-XSN]|uniref:Major capsid protein n=1 Tax=Vibrio phage PVP-XSN TaxID=3056214 RepID=A0AAX3Y6J4_9CAUD|nr:minor capsid protein E [Vibrio phage PVP-XSN]
MAIDLFDTRTMIPMLREMKPANTFLLDRYFGNIVESESKKIDIDIYVGKRRIAPFVHPKIGGKTVEKLGYKTDSFEPPMVGPRMLTTAEDMLKRSPGENIYNAKSPDERAAEQIGMDLAELDDMITRREEAMAAEALFSGQVTVEGDGYDLEVVKYWPGGGDDPYLALGAGDRWNEDTADISKDLRDASLRIMQRSGITPSDALMGRSALDAMLNNTGFTEKLDKRRIDTGQIDPQKLPNGVTYWGYLKDSGLDIWTYDDWYLDPETGENKPFVPLKKVLIGSPNVRTTRAYGVVVDVEKGSFALSRVPVSYITRGEQEGRMVQVKSKPLPIVHQVHGFEVLEVLA